MMFSVIVVLVIDILVGMLVAPCVKIMREYWEEIVKNTSPRIVRDNIVGFLFTILALIMAISVGLFMTYLLTAI